MQERESWAAEYVAAKLNEIEEALSVLDRSETPFAYAEERRFLVARAARLLSVLATYQGSTSLH